MQFRSVEDPGVPADMAVCVNASFYDPANMPNVLLGASLWSIEARASDGTIMNDEIRRIGTAHACALIASLAPGAEAPFYIELAVGDQFFRADGTCRVTSNTIPQPGLILAGCSLKVQGELSAGLMGGIATSNSVFNPFSLPGFQTGSLWTVHIYQQ
ncbi:MAG TPA: hypothetical protein VN604_05070 [Nitrospirota bacterium]|nr:hypothetical protein [Nitrospirota bacterium]